MNIIRIESIDSTNSYLKELAGKKSLEEGTVVITNNQIAGKGQQGNVWESEAGKNITCSILFYPSFLPVKKIFLLSEVVSIAVKKTLDIYTEGITIKWPNDIYYQDKKIAGILVENELSGNMITSTIAGIGVNINQEHFLSNAPNPVSLKQITGKDHDLEIFFEKLTNNILFNYELLRVGNTETIICQYHDFLYRKTGIHCFKDKEGIFYASIKKISEDGFLHLTTKENEERTYFVKNICY